jgi:GNAT superfamily N-acetyltransferase
MAAEVRAARVGEETELLRLYEWLFAEPGGKPSGWDADRARRALGEAIAGEDAAVLVAEESGEPIGLCSAYLDLNSVRFGLRCWVEDLVVDPGRRSRGVGGALLDATAAWARERSATHLELDTGLARTDAQRFYERRDPDAVGHSYSWVL